MFKDVFSYCFVKLFFFIFQVLRNDGFREEKWFDCLVVEPVPAGGCSPFLPEVHILNRKISNKILLINIS